MPRRCGAGAGSRGRIADGWRACAPANPVAGTTSTPATAFSARISSRCLRGTSSVDAATRTTPNLRNRTSARSDYSTSKAVALGQFAGDVVESTLDWYELLQAAIVGSQRQVKRLREGMHDAHGYNGDGWSIHIEGAAAEMAYAKATNRYWSVPVADDFRSVPGDVGTVQIRSTPRPNGCLILHPGDRDDAPFVLAIGRAPAFDFVGWGYAGDLKRREYWREDTGRPAFFVPQDALRT